MAELSAAAGRQSPAEEEDDGDWVPGGEEDEEDEDDDDDDDEGDDDDDDDDDDEEEEESDDELHDSREERNDSDDAESDDDDDDDDDDASAGSGAGDEMAGSPIRAPADAPVGCAPAGEAGGGEAPAAADALPPAAAPAVAPAAAGEGALGGRSAGEVAAAAILVSTLSCGLPSPARLVTRSPAATTPSVTFADAVASPSARARAGAPAGTSTAPEYISRRTRAHVSLEDMEIDALEALLQPSPASSPPPSPNPGMSAYLLFLKGIVGTPGADAAAAGAAVDEEDEEEDDDYNYLLDKALTERDDEPEEYAEMRVDLDELRALHGEQRRGQRKRRGKKAAGAEAAEAEARAGADPEAEPAEEAGAGASGRAPSKRPLKPKRGAKPGGAKAAPPAAVQPARWTDAQLERLQRQMGAHYQLLLQLLFRARAALPHTAHPRLSARSEPLGALACAVLLSTANMAAELLEHAEVSLAFRALCARPCYATPLTTQRPKPPTDGAAAAAPGAAADAGGAAHGGAQQPQPPPQPPVVWSVFAVAGVERVRSTLASLGELPRPSEQPSAASLCEQLKLRSFSLALAESPYTALFDPALRPLAAAAAEQPPAASFSLAEEKLVVIGLKRFGASRFDEIQRRLLPTKSATLLRERVKLRSSRRAAQDTPNPILDWKVERLGSQFGDYERTLILSTVSEHGAQPSTWERLSMQSLRAHSSTAIREYYHNVLAPDGDDDDGDGAAGALAEPRADEAQPAAVLATLAPGAVAMPLPPVPATAGARADAVPLDALAVSPFRPPVVVNAVPVARSPPRAPAPPPPPRRPPSPLAPIGAAAAQDVAMPDSVPDGGGEADKDFAVETLVDSDAEGDESPRRPPRQPPRHPTADLDFAVEVLCDSDGEGERPR